MGGAGFALGVIIAIERNNTKTSLEVPEGSNVAISQQGNVKVKLPDGGDVAAHGPPENRLSDSKSKGDLSDEELSSCDAAVRAIIEKYDTDGDGMLTWSEWQEGTIGTGFPDFDDNDLAEYTELMFVLRKTIRRYKLLHRTTDVNRDGVLTADEWSRLKADISSADTNKDGRITTTELSFFIMIRDPARRSVIPPSSQPQRRQPIIMVRARDMGSGQSGFWPVDAEGILLPTDDIGPNQTRNYLRLEWGNPGHAVRVGTPYGGPVVAGAAAIAAALGDDWKPMGLELVVVLQDKPEVAQPTEPTYILLPKGGDPTAVLQWLDGKTTRTLQMKLNPGDRPPSTLVAWGHAPGRESEGEPTSAQKISLLLEVVKQHGPLDRPGLVIDLSEIRANPSTALATASARLDFRIAITRASNDDPTVSRVIAKLIEQLTLSDGATISSDSKHEWLECDIHIWDNITSREDRLIFTMHNEKLYILVSNEPDGTMLSSDQGDRAWEILSAHAAKDALDHPAISIELDEAGGRRLGQLTQQNLNRPLAMIIDNQVVMVPTIRSKITNQVQITGQFALEQLDRIVQSIEGVGKVQKEK